MSNELIFFSCPVCSIRKGTDADNATILHRCQCGKRFIVGTGENIQFRKKDSQQFPVAARPKRKTLLVTVPTKKKQDPFAMPAMQQRNQKSSAGWIILFALFAISPLFYLPKIFDSRQQKKKELVNSPVTKIRKIAKSPVPLPEKKLAAKQLPIVVAPKIEITMPDTERKLDNIMRAVKQSPKQKPAAAIPGQAIVAQVDPMEKKINFHLQQTTLEYAFFKLCKTAGMNYMRDETREILGEQSRKNIGRVSYKNKKIGDIIEHLARQNNIEIDKNDDGLLLVPGKIVAKIKREETEEKWGLSTAQRKRLYSIIVQIRNHRRSPQKLLGKKYNLTNRAINSIYAEGNRKKWDPNLVQIEIHKAQKIVCGIVK